MPTEAGVAYVAVEYDPRSLGRLEATTRAQGRSIAGMWGTAAARAGKALALGVGAGTVVAGIGLYKATKLAMGFQQELNVMQATSGATGDQMARVSRLAIALGKDIHLPATSAQDAAEGMTELAKGGLSVAESMKAARGVMQLAVAGQLAVADAAGVTANALNAFSLGGAQATHVADLLAGAANASTGEVSDFAQGLQYAGTAANAAGQSIDITVAALAEMANKGLSGSVAGSSLAQALRSLQAPSGKASAAIKKFGLDVYDAHGNMKPLDEIAQTFTDHLGDMTQKQQNATLATIFGSRAVQAARIVFLGGRDALDKYRDKVARTGNAQRLAEARSRGFAGAVQALQSNLETLGITVGLKLLPVLTVAAGKLSEFVDFLGKLAESPSVTVAVHIAVAGVADFGRSIREALFGHGMRVKPVVIPAGKLIEVQRESASTGLVGKLMAAITGANWAPVGLAIGAAIGATLTFTSDMTAKFAQSLIDNSDTFAVAATLIALKIVAVVLDPAFWLEHWRTVLAIGISIIPFAKFGQGGKLIAEVLTRPIGRLFLRVFGRLPGVVQDFAIAAEVIIRGGFARAARAIIRQISGAASLVPNRFQTAFGAVLRIALGVFGRVAAAIRGRVSGAITALAAKIRKSVIGQTVLWLGKLTIIQGAINLIVTAFDKIKAAVQWLIDNVSRIHFPSIPGGSGLDALKKIVPGIASGGIATRPTLAMIGEGGQSEAIIPLDKLSSLMPNVQAPRPGSMTLRGRMHISNWRDGMAEIDLRISDSADMGARA